MIDRKNLLLIIFVLIVATLIGIWLPYVRYQKLQNQNPSPTVNSQAAEVQVIYTNEGFTPNIVTVKVGTTVAWVNRSSRPMWIASDPHPSHTGLPGFDQQGIIIPGASFLAPFFAPQASAHGPSMYEYTFTKTGTWNYHNHIFPNDRGTVIAE